MTDNIYRIKLYIKGFGEVYSKIIKPGTTKTEIAPASGLFLPRRSKENCEERLL